MSLLNPNKQRFNEVRLKMSKETEISSYYCRYSCKKIMKCMLLFCLFTGSTMADSVVDSFDEAKQIALKLESETKNKQHKNEVLLPYFGQKYTSVLKDCFDTITKPDPSKFEFVVEIAGSGQVIRVYNNHETNISKCMNKELENEKFPEPIIAPYYLHITMSFN